MRNRKSTVFGLIVLVLVALICIVLLNSNSLLNENAQSDQTNKNENINSADQPDAVETMENGLNVESKSEPIGVTSPQNLPAQQPDDILIKNISGNLNVRELPQHDSTLVCTINNFYTRLYFYGETSEGRGSDNKYYIWYKIVTSSNIIGWVRSDLVISQDANVKYPYVSDNEGTDYWKYTSLDLNIRSEPSHDSELVGTVTDCNTYIHGCYPDLGLKTGIGSDGQLHEWIKVIVNSELQGWVRYDLIIETNSVSWVDDIFVKNTTMPLNVRALPQHNSDLVVRLEKNDIKMYYNGISEWGLGSDGVMHEWYQVDISSEERGWVRSDLVKSYF